MIQYEHQMKDYPMKKKPIIQKKTGPYNVLAKVQSRREQFKMSVTSAGLASNSAATASKAAAITLPKEMSALQL